VSEEITDLEMFWESVAGVIVCESKQRKWVANWPFIASVAKILNITKDGVEPGGRHHDEILSRIGTQTTNLTESASIDEAAERVAEDLFGPQGIAAPDFMKLYALFE
jgi:hypothetical protein